MLDVVVDYTYALDTLDRYDYQELKIEGTTGKEFFHATYENAMEVICELHEKFGGSTLFGNEKDDSFKSSIGQIYQTFGGIDLYPSVEEKAAMLLYLVTKNHSFSDGNKRIAATLFLWFLNGNGILHNEDGTKRIADNTLVALTRPPSPSFCPKFRPPKDGIEALAIASAGTIIIAFAIGYHHTFSECILHIRTLCLANNGKCEFERCSGPLGCYQAVTNYH